MSQNNGFFDKGPMNVTGGITARRARVIHKDGTLFVFTTPNAWVSRETSEPELTKDVWTVTSLEEETIEFTRRGCSACGWTLGKVTAADLLAKV